MSEYEILTLASKANINTTRGNGEIDLSLLSKLERLVYLARGDDKSLEDLDKREEPQRRYG
jgi:hypothetical protein